MNNDDLEKLVRELRLIRICAVIFTMALVFRIATDFLNFHL